MVSGLPVAMTVIAVLVLDASCSELCAWGGEESNGNGSGAKEAWSTRK